MKREEAVAIYKEVMGLAEHMGKMPLIYSYRDMMSPQKATK